MHLIEPKKGACNEEIGDLFASIIENRCMPMGVHPHSRIFMFIERCPVEAIEGKVVCWKMSWNPIEDHSDPLMMHVIDKILKIGWRSISTRGGKKPSYLIAPRFIERMFHHRHQLDM